jgi:hypothetical protein
MNIIPGYAIQVIPSDLGTLIALDRDRLEADVEQAISEDETDFAQGFDFRCEVIDDAVIVNGGDIRVPTTNPDAAYFGITILQTTLSGFLPEEEGDIYIEVALTEDPLSASLQTFGQVTFINEYNYSAGISNKSRFAFSASISKGIMPPSDTNYTRVRLAEYSVNDEGVISLTQTHLGSITVQRPTQHNDFAIAFGIV